MNENENKFWLFPSLVVLKQVKILNPKKCSQDSYVRTNTFEYYFLTYKRQVKIKLNLLLKYVSV